MDKLHIALAIMKGKHFFSRKGEIERYSCL